MKTWKQIKIKNMEMWVDYTESPYTRFSVTIDGRYYLGTLYGSGKYTYVNFMTNANRASGKMANGNITFAIEQYINQSVID